jgi:hypothetical protein
VTAHLYFDIQQRRRRTPRLHDACPRDGTPTVDYLLLTATGAPPPSVSPSSLSDFKTCPRLFRFRYIEKAEEPPSAVMVRGSMCHDALEQVLNPW